MFVEPALPFCHHSAKDRDPSQDHGMGKRIGRDKSPRLFVPFRVREALFSDVWLQGRIFFYNSPPWGGKESKGREMGKKIKEKGREGRGK